MRRKISVIIIFLIFFVFCPLILGKVNAAFLKFDKETVSVNAGENFELQVIVDAGSDEINSIDAYVIYDAAVLEVNSVTEGSFFPTVSKDISSGRIYIAGMVDDPASSKTGSGIVATINFKALKDGSVDITFDCDGSKIVKADIDATNIIECSKNGSSQVTIGSGNPSGNSSDSASSIPSPTPSTLPRSGIFDNLISFGLSGLILFSIGLTGKLLLKF